MQASKLQPLREIVMANPNQPGTTSTTPQPIDPEEMREIQLLAEAVLVSFTATPNPFAPFGHAKLAWDITMPTTVIPGVQIEVHVSGLGDQAFDPKGSRPVAPYNGTTY